MLVPKRVRISASQLERFRQIRKAFPKPPLLPRPNEWQQLSDNAVWECVFRQVMAVGGAVPADKFMRSPDLRQRVSYHRLYHLHGQSRVKQAISGVLREVGTRYATRDWRRCAKTVALCRNLQVLREFNGGPRGFVRHVATITGPDQDRRRIDFVSARLHFIKSKGVRDLLTTSFGLLRTGIALDARVLGALRAIGVQIPRGVTQSEARYTAFEADLVEQVCGPLRISGAELDQPRRGSAVGNYTSNAKALMPE